MAEFLDEIPAGKVSVEPSVGDMAVEITINRPDGDPAIKLKLNRAASMTLADKIYSILRRLPA